MLPVWTDRLPGIPVPSPKTKWFGPWPKPVKPAEPTPPESPTMPAEHCRSISVLALPIPSISRSPKRPKSSWGIPEWLPGSALKRKNNHPFAGRACGEGFALAHNGVYTTKKVLRRVHHLPPTAIETDSYIAVQTDGATRHPQLRQPAFSWLRRLRALFCFTVLDRKRQSVLCEGR